MTKSQSSKKAQSGSSAATLVAVIALLIVLYILFLPPDVREDLLESNDTDDDGPDRLLETLLRESPGRLESLSELEIEHNLPSVNLFALTNSVVLKKINAIYVKNGLFDKKSERLQFSIADLKNTNNIKLSFIARESQGRLLISLNGNEIYNSDIAGTNVDPIELPKELLEGSNVLEFGASDVGFAFWKTNEYSLENIQVTGDITDVSTQESRNVFIFSATEKYNLEKVRLRFLADCNPADVGVLEVFVNNQQVFSGIPDCGIIRPIDVAPSYLDAGENKIVFRTQKGRYLIDRVSVTSKLKEINYPAYYFEVDRNQFADIRDNKADVNLSIRFVDNEEFRKAKVFINGKTFSINTKEPRYSRNIDTFIEEGQNGIRVEPDKSTLDIIELRIDLVGR